MKVKLRMHVEMEVEADDGEDAAKTEAALRNTTARWAEFLEADLQTYLRKHLPPDIKFRFGGGDDEEEWRG